MLAGIKILYRRNKKKVLMGTAFLAGLVAFGDNLSAVSNFIMTHNPLSEENRNPPLTIGMTIIEAEKNLGKPQEINFIARSYFSHGIEINPDYEHEDEVGGITVRKLPSGVMYRGKIEGIRLNSSFDELKDIKGNPTYWGVESSDSSTAIWYENENVTIVHFSPNAEKKWSADSITYTRAASMVSYRAILLSVFQELKAGRVSQFAEELAERENSDFFEKNDIGMLSLRDFSEQYLHQDYEFVLMEPALNGGAEIYLAFGEKLLVFWIYPLGWEQPTLRAILDLDIFKKNHGE